MDYISKSDIIAMSFEHREGKFCLACIEADEELRKSPLNEVFFDELSTEADFEPGAKCQRCGKKFQNIRGRS